MRRWYVIHYGGSRARRLAADAREAVRIFCEVGVPYDPSDITGVTVEGTREQVPPELWRLTSPAPPS